MSIEKIDRQRPQLQVNEWPSVLFINPQPTRIIEELGLPPYVNDIVRVTGIPRGRIIECRVADGDRLPGLDGIDAIISGGSSNSVYEKGAGKEWIGKTRAYLKAAIGKVPGYYICFSHQAVADEVVLGPAGFQFGIDELTLTDAGQAYFPGLAKKFVLFSSHQDTVTTPLSGSALQVTELVYSSVYRNKAFRIVDSYSGIETISSQPHPEFNLVIMSKLADRRESLLTKGGTMPEGKEQFLEGLRARHEEAERNGKIMVRTWLNKSVGRRLHMTR